MASYSMNATRTLLQDATRSSLRGRSIGFGSPSASPSTTVSISSICRHSHSTTHPIYHRSQPQYCYRQLSSATQFEDATAASDKHSSPLLSPHHVAGETSNSNSKLKHNTNANNGDEDVPRQRISDVKISEVLKRKHTLRWVEPVISKDATVREAITLCIERKLNGMMVVDRSDTIKRKAATTLDMKQKCVGLITSRDILRMMASSIKEGKSSDEVLKSTNLQANDSD
jgi:hypothetical protein